MMRPARTVAAIHDLSGVGRCALTVVMPVLSAMGAQVCPVPTAVLSAHTAFSGIAVRDLTDFLPAYLDHWRALGLRFDAVYAGYLGSPAQVEIVSDLLAEQEGALKVLDPVMGDDGRLYSGMAEEMPAKCRCRDSGRRGVRRRIRPFVRLRGACRRWRGRPPTAAR